MRWRARPARRRGRISAWREEFLAAGREGLKTRPRAGGGPPAGRGAAQGRRAVDGARHPAGAAWRRWTAPSVAEALNVAGRLEAPLARGLPGRGGVQVGGVRAAPPTQRLGAHRSCSRRRPGPGRRDARRRAAGGDPPRDRRVAVRRRGPPKICARLRAARHPHQPQARAAPDARGRAARADAAGAQALPAPARRHDHRRRPRHAVGDRRRPRPGRASEGRCAVFAIVDHASGEAWVDAAPQDGPLRRRRPAPRGLHRALRLGRAGRRRRAGAALRRRPLLPLRPLPGRDRPPRHRPLARPSTTSPRPTAASRSSSRRSRSRCSGSSASTRSSSCAPASASFAARLQPALAARTPRLPHPTPSPRQRSVRPPWHDHRVHQPSVR